MLGALILKVMVLAQVEQRIVRSKENQPGAQSVDSNSVESFLFSLCL